MYSCMVLAERKHMSGRSKEVVTRTLTTYLPWSLRPNITATSDDRWCQLRQTSFLIKQSSAHSSMLDAHARNASIFAKLATPSTYTRLLFFIGRGAFYACQHLFFHHWCHLRQKHCARKRNIHINNTMANAFYRHERFLTIFTRPALHNTFLQHRNVSWYIRWHVRVSPNLQGNYRAPQEYAAIIYPHSRICSWAPRARHTKN